MTTALRIGILGTGGINMRMIDVIYRKAGLPTRGLD